MSEGELIQEYIDDCKNGELCTCKTCLCMTVRTCALKDDCKDCTCQDTFRGKGKS